MLLKVHTFQDGLRVAELDKLNSTQDNGSQMPGRSKPTVNSYLLNSIHNLVNGALGKTVNDMAIYVLPESKGTGTVWR